MINPQPIVVKPTQIQQNENQYSYLPARPLSEANTTPIGVKPQETAGRLVKENVFQSAGSTVKSYGKYAKYFYNAAFNGEGTDYSVGKINDLAIRTGSLGIAAVLATSKVFPFAKGMEFVGLATWFASMAVWPKIIGTPIKAKTGVDINQKYVDSYGRRKSFFEDPQYLPFDLYRHIDKHGKYNLNAPEYEKLDKIGDKLGIPRDINNRHEAIHDKMRQVATQGNTLWMLTAGVMTPVLSSLAADALQKPLKEGLEKYRFNKELKNIDELGATFDKVLAKNNFNLEILAKDLGVEIKPEIKSEFSALNKARLTEKEFSKLQEFLRNRYFGSGIHDSIETHMKKTMGTTDPVVFVTPEFRESLKKISFDTIKELIDAVPESKKGNIPREILEFKGFNDDQVGKVIYDTFFAQGGELNSVSRNSLKNLMPREIMMAINKNNTIDQGLLRKINSIMETRMEALYEETKRVKINTSTMDKMFNFVETHMQVQEKISKFEEATIKNISESITANNWGKIPQKYIKALGFNKAELAQLATTDSTFASKAVTKKIEEIAQDPQRLDKVVKAMSELAKEAITKEEKAVIALIGTSNTPGLLTKYKKLMEEVAAHNFDANFNYPLSVYFKNKLKSVKYKFRNTSDSLIKPIKAIDIIKNTPKIVNRILGNTAADYAKIISEDQSTHTRNYYMFYNTPDYQKAKESLTKYIKDIAIEKNDVNNWSTKFEAIFPGLKQGANHSEGMNSMIADAIFGEFSPEVAKSMEADIVKKFNQNNLIMRGRFLGLVNRLWEDHTTTGHPIWEPIKGLFVDRKISNYETLLALFEERRFELSDTQIREFKLKTNGILTAIKNGHEYNVAADMNAIADILNFHTPSKLYSSNVPNKKLAEQCGKNITDFFKGAAQDIRSRSKWSKLVYGLLIGTTALSAVIIAMMGRKNHFNKDIYEKKAIQQGVNSDNK